ncbi:integrase [Pseudomonas sp. v388]|uniref:tyrosine-type recombinase/integrase n=1 Tax=Pseudomonas sp. v388 TaxID=2479849 RepID=UPI000F7858B6|nr:tyrosine-type recombinase/integrase [Pseudomonas sp. v388]RRV08046.1 integrase [Pseudomonas sp. v388]
MADHLIRKKGEDTWYVRLKVPKDVVTKIGHSVFIKSLKTTSHREALHARHAHLAEWRKLISEARGQRKLPDDWQEQVVKTTVSVEGLIQARRRALIGERYDGPRRTEKEIQEFVQNNPDIVATIENALPPKTGNEMQDKLNAYSAVSDLLKDVIGGAFIERYSFDNDQEADLHELIDTPNNQQIEPKITTARLARFRAHRQAQGIELKTIDQQESKLQKLASYLKNNTKNLTSDSVGDWLRTLGLASKTLTQYLLAGSMYWKWAIRHDEQWRSTFKDRANPFENHDLPKVRGKAKADARRMDYTLADLKRLMEAAQQQGKQTLVDLTLLGYFTGARIEELCQLKSSDLIKIEDVDFFDIKDSKTAAGIRRVPIHPCVMETVQRLVKDSIDGFLIPSTSRNKYNKRADALSKSFGRLKTRLGFGRSHVFHSVRVTAITQLLRHDVPGPIVAQLVGHETGLVTFDVYSKGASPAQLVSAISKLISILPNQQ